MTNISRSGVFVVLYDFDTLKLYLHKGVYGFLMPPVYEAVSRRSGHYAALGDYACVREGTHVFFFLKRKIIYGGQVMGSKKYGAFYINGRYSPMGKLANAELYWDESKRMCYKPTNNPGVFALPKISGERCQPYIILFRDNLGIKGNAITSDQLYFELGRYSYPLPSNTISGMGFCTMTPGEVDILLHLLKNEPMDHYDAQSDEKIELQGEPLPFEPKYGFRSIKEGMELATSEAHLEAMILANPELLPEDLRPNPEDTLCRRVPMSPFKPPKWIDKANICIYSEPYIINGTLPNKIIELKTRTVTKADIAQIIKYLKWLYMVLKEQASQVKVYLCGPSFKPKIEKFIPQEYRYQVRLIEF
ncbi:MAG: hypothetical protein ACPL28_10830 [bacterium]